MVSSGWKLVALLGFAAACNGSAPAPPKPPPPPTPDPEPEGPGEPETLDTGKDCVTATYTCDGGVCDADLKNGCETPVTCELLIMAICESSTTKGEARGKKRGTIPAGESDKFQAQADCEGAGVSATIAESLTCK